MSARRRRPQAWWALQKERLGGWLARSSHVFLVGVIVACAVEVFVDWNSTLFEINVLRDGLRQRGSSYVGVLVKASEAPLRDRDAGALERLSVGLFDDEDVAYVRFSDAHGELLYEELRPGLDAEFSARHGQGVIAFYRHQMARDSEQILANPQALADRMRRSRYRDIVQRWSDGVAALTARLSKPVPAPAPHHIVLYQDRLADETRRHDREMTYAIGVVRDAQGGKEGVVLVAFSMARTNDATTKKFLKGGLMIAFFVGLILVQNMIARRDKLRLLDLEERHHAAKEALSEAMPGGGSAHGWQVGGAVQQAEGPVDGCLWALTSSPSGLELLVIEPDGEGIDAAATALQIGRAHGRRHGLPTTDSEPSEEGQPAPQPATAQGPPPAASLHEGAAIGGDIVEEISALGEVVAGLPLTRPIGLVLLRIAPDTLRITAAASGVGGIFVLGEGVRSLAPVGGEEEAPAGVVGPLRRFEGVLGPGELVALIAAGGSQKPKVPFDGAAVAGYALGMRAIHADLNDLAQATAEWARGRWPGLAGSDLVVVLAGRAG